MKERYIVIKNNIIIKDFRTIEGLPGVQKAIQSYNIDYDEIIKIHNESTCLKGIHKGELTLEGLVRPLQERVYLGFVNIPEKYKIEGEKFVLKTLQEQVDDGDIELSPYFKIVDNEFISKTNEELVLDGVLTQAELDQINKDIADEELIQSEIRRIAIANLQDQGLID